MGKKEDLSNYLKSLLHRCVEEKVYEFGTPTGTGKSHEIAIASVSYFPQKFKQILILTIQNKLSREMEENLMRLCDPQNGTITQSQIVYIENNQNNFRRACKDGTAVRLIEQMLALIEAYDQKDKQTLRNWLKNPYTQMSSAYAAAMEILNNEDRIQSNSSMEKYKSEIVQKAEQEYRKAVKQAFSMIRAQEYKSDDTFRFIKRMVSRCPALEQVYPQINFHEKKVIVTSVHKAYDGIDLIFAPSVSLKSFQNSTDKRLVIFDESDQCATALRQSIIDKSLNRNGFASELGKNYDGWLHIISLMKLKDEITMKYYDGEIQKGLECFGKRAEELWKEKMGDTPKFRNIFLRESEDKELLYRHGVFMVGGSGNVRLSTQNPTVLSYICYKKGDTFLTLAHASKKDELTDRYDTVVGLESFIRLCLKIQRSFLYNMVFIILKEHFLHVEEYERKLRELYQEENSKDLMNAPSMEQSVHTFFARFVDSNERIFERMMLDYIQSQAYIRVKDEQNKSFLIRDSSIYAQGVQLYDEQMDDFDKMNRVQLQYLDIYTTPEQLVLELVRGGNTVILSSATAASKSIIANFDLEYLRQELRDRYQALSYEENQQIARLLKETYPKGHRIEVKAIESYTPLICGPTVRSLALDEKMVQMFHPQAIASGWVQHWYSLTLFELDKKYKGNVQSVVFELGRIRQFIEVYHDFWINGDIHSLIYFQNSKATEQSRQLHVIASLIDGTFLDETPPRFGEWPDNWNNPHLFILDDWEKIGSSVIPALENGQTGKVMMVTAYNSIKAGCNLQYRVPDGSCILHGDSWGTDEVPRKDWDAVFLQLPTNYLSIDKKKEGIEKERDILKVLLSEAMFLETGLHSTGEVKMWVTNARYQPNEFFFNASSVKVDKSAWIFTTIEQAVGRICRTKNKPHTTHIFYDSALHEYYTHVLDGKAMTPEFQALVEAIENGGGTVADLENIQEQKRAKKANLAYERASINLSVALRYCIRLWDASPCEEEDTIEAGEEIPHCVRNARYLEEMIRDVMARHPTIGSYDELTPDMAKVCKHMWGDWPMDEQGACHYYTRESGTDGKGTSVLVTHTQSGRRVLRTVSPESTRLTLLMRNPVIRSYFERNGYATEWKPGLLLHPNLLVDRYTGHIGELAFIALLLHYTDCDASDIKVMTEGKDWELSDIVIRNGDGTNRIAFDVKNYNPNNFHSDRIGDMRTQDKRIEKERRLGCKLITVNLMSVGEHTMDATREIYGLIRQDGMIIPESIHTLKTMVGLNKKENNEQD